MSVCKESVGPGSRTAESIQVIPKDCVATTADPIGWATRVVYRFAYRAHLLANYFFRPDTRGAYVLVWYNEQLLLIRNSYKPLLTLPSGGIRRHESAVEAARRELVEETGLDLPVSSLRYVGNLISRQEFKNDKIYFFEVRLQHSPTLKVDGREVVWLGFRKPADIVNLPMFPPVRDFLSRQYGIV